MASRQNLHRKLKELFPNIKVYYQPPAKLEYPCLLYDLNDIDTKKANNKTYIKDRRYSLTYISLNPDPITIVNGEESLVEDVLLELPNCSFDRHYEKDNLHHYVFSLFY